MSVRGREVILPQGQQFIEQKNSGLEGKAARGVEGAPVRRLDRFCLPVPGSAGTLTPCRSARERGEP